MAAVMGSKPFLNLPQISFKLLGKLAVPSLPPPLSQLFLPLYSAHYCMVYHVLIDLYFVYVCGVARCGTLWYIVVVARV